MTSDLRKKAERINIYATESWDGIVSDGDDPSRVLSWLEELQDFIQDVFLLLDDVDRIEELRQEYREKVNDSVSTLNCAGSERTTWWW